MFRFHLGELPVMKLTSKEFGQPIALCLRTTNATSSEETLAERMSACRYRSEGKDFSAKRQGKLIILGRADARLGSAQLHFVETECDVVDTKSSAGSVSFVSDGLDRVRACLDQMEAIGQHRQVASAPNPQDRHRDDDEQEGN